MSNYRRKKIEGAYYFFTVVTYSRRSFLTDDLTRSLLKESLRQVQADRPFAMPALCLMPDHLQCIWRLPAGDSDYSTRWSIIKRLFSKAYIVAGGKGMSQTHSRVKKRELGIWQRRFWEHRIRDEGDYWNHLHYIHYNPLKHKLVECLEDWPYSTFHRFRQQGIYDDFDWSLFQGDEYDERMEFVE